MSYQDQGYSPTVYSGYAMYNPVSTIDKTGLTFSMWKTTLKVSIIPVIESGAGNDEPAKYDYRNSATIFLTPSKAHMFATILKKFKEDPEKYSNYGVNTPQCIISVDSAKTFGKDTNDPVITIRKLGDAGNIELSYSYECRNDFYSSVVGFSASSPKDYKQDFEMFKNLDIDMIIEQLEQYYVAMTKTIAFTVTHELYPYLDKIAAKVGVDLSTNYQRKSGFFTGGQQGQATNGFQMNGHNTTQTYDASQFKNLIQ